MILQNSQKYGLRNDLSSINQVPYNVMLKITLACLTKFPLEIEALK